MGAQLSLAVDNGTLVASPIVPEKKRLTLAELLEGSDEMAALNDDAKAWDASARVGNEAI